MFDKIAQIKNLIGGRVFAGGRDIQKKNLTSIDVLNNAYTILDKALLKLKTITSSKIQYLGLEVEALDEKDGSIKEATIKFQIPFLDKIGSPKTFYTEMKVVSGQVQAPEFLTDSIQRKAVFSDEGVKTLIDTDDYGLLDDMPKVKKDDTHYRIEPSLASRSDMIFIKKGWDTRNLQKKAEDEPSDMVGYLKEVVEAGKISEGAIYPANIDAVRAAISSLGGQVSTWLGSIDDEQIFDAIDAYWQDKKMVAASDKRMSKKACVLNDVVVYKETKELAMVQQVHDGKEKTYTISFPWRRNKNRRENDIQNHVQLPDTSDQMIVVKEKEIETFEPVKGEELKRMAGMFYLRENIDPPMKPGQIELIIKSLADGSIVRTPDGLGEIVEREKAGVDISREKPLQPKFKVFLAKSQEEKWFAWTDIQKIDEGEIRNILGPAKQKLDESKKQQEEPELKEETETPKEENTHSESSASIDGEIIVQEAVAAPGFEHAVKEMKKDPQIDNPWALSWSMKNKGDKPGDKKESSLNSKADGEEEIGNKIPGGKAEGKTPEDFDQEQLEIGSDVEMEHTTDMNIAIEIAMDHLIEDPDYYKKLVKIEQGKCDVCQEEQEEKPVEELKAASLKKKAVDANGEELRVGDTVEFVKDEGQIGNSSRIGKKGQIIFIGGDDAEREEMADALTIDLTGTGYSYDELIPQDWVKKVSPEGEGQEIVASLEKKASIEYLASVSRTFEGFLLPIAQYTLSNILREQNPQIVVAQGWKNQTGLVDIQVDVDQIASVVNNVVATYPSMVVSGETNYGEYTVNCYARNKREAADWMSDFETKMATENQYRGKCLNVEDGQIRFADIPKVSWDDVILEEKAKKDIRLNTIAFLGDEKLAAIGVKKRGLVMYGPPGTGKTSVVKAIFNELQGKSVSRIYVTAESFKRMSISNLFNLLPFLGKTVLAFEDIDMIGGDREAFSGSNLLGDLLTNLDGMRKYYDQTVIMASTNRMSLLDDALANRPCRFDRKIEIGLPNKASLKMLYLKFSGVTVGDDIIVLSSGFTGSHVAEAVNTARILAANNDSTISDSMKEACEIVRGNFFTKTAGKTVVAFGIGDKIQSNIEPEMVGVIKDKMENENLVKWDDQNRFGESDTFTDDEISRDFKVIETASINQPTPEGSYGPEHNMNYQPQGPNEGPLETLNSDRSQRKTADLVKLSDAQIENSNLMVEINALQDMKDFIGITSEQETELVQLKEEAKRKGLIAMQSGKLTTKREKFAGFEKYCSDKKCPHFKKMGEVAIKNWCVLWQTAVENVICTDKMCIPKSLSGQSRPDGGETQFGR